MTKLLAGRWSIDGLTKLEEFSRPLDIGMRWSVATHGLERLEVTVRAVNKYDLYDRYDTHLGQRLAVYSDWCYRPIAGFITEVRPLDGLQVQYVARGPGLRLYDALDTTIYASSTGLDDVLKTLLTDHVSISSSDQANIDNNTTTIGGWAPDIPQGNYPGDIIAELLQRSDSGGNVWDFWFQDQPFLDGIKLQDWLPYYKARSTTASLNWLVKRADIQRLTPSRDIHALRTSVDIYYGTITGTATAGGSSTLLQDTGASFWTDGVLPGDKAVNLTDGEQATIVAVNSQTSITTHPLPSGSWDNTDSYAIELQEAKSGNVQSDNITADYWSVKYAEFRPEMNSTQANQYASMLSTTAPRQRNPFTIGANVVKDGGFTSWPLWEMIAQGGGYIRIGDLYPATSLFDTSLDDKSTFFITGLDYDHTFKHMAVEVDHPSRRLDARLRAQGLLDSEIVLRHSG